LNYPGKQVLNIYANDSAGNLNSFERIFYINTSLNITKWKNDLILYSNNISNITVFNSTGNLISENISINQNLTIELNFTNISLIIINLSANDVDWSYNFFVFDENLEFENSVINDIGTNATHYVYFKNFTKFYNETNNYYGRLRFPRNRSYFSNLYYCPEENLSQCYKISSTCNTYLDSNNTACFNDTSDFSYIYIPHFSAVFGDNDTVSPTITFVAPQNNSVLNNGFNNNLTIITNEITTCTYKLNSGSSYSLNHLGNNKFRKTFNNENTDAWIDGEYNFTVTCTDLFNNNKTEIIFFNVNDTTDPVINYTDVDASTDEADITVRTNEPTLCNYTYDSSVYLLPNSNYRINHEKTVNSSGMYRIRCYDKAENYDWYNLDVDFEEEEEEEEEEDEQDSGSSSPSSGPTKIQTYWEELSIGNHTMYVSSSEIAITKLVFSLINEKNRSSSLTVSRVDNLPTSFSELEDYIYQYLRISPYNLNEEDIEKVIINFKVSNNWFDTNKTDRETVKLHRYINGWNEVSTKLVNSDSNYFYYEAESPGFSYFGINAKQKIQQEQVEDQEDQLDQEDQIIVSDTEPSITGEVVQNETSDNEKSSLSEEVTKNPFKFILPILLFLIIASIISFYFYQKKYSVVTDKDLVDLREYVQKCEVEGVSFEKIREVLINVGWKPSIIDLVLHDVHIPHSELMKLVNYIKFSLNKNLSKEQIKENLKKVGWQPEVIQEAFKELKESL
jgi:PGF-pre-PGF domain-containing protein